LIDSAKAVSEKYGLKIDHQNISNWLIDFKEYLTIRRMKDLPHEMKQAISRGELKTNTLLKRFLMKLACFMARFTPLSARATSYSIGVWPKKEPQ